LYSATTKIKILNAEIFVMPYKNYYPKKKISEINPETDFLIRVTGFVVDKKNDMFIDNPEIMNKVSIHQFLSIFGSTIPSNNAFEIKANVVQDLTGLDINLYKRVDELYKRLGV
jgi:hypothetical protein